LGAFFYARRVIGGGGTDRAGGLTAVSPSAFGATPRRARIGAGGGWAFAGRIASECQNSALTPTGIKSWRGFPILARDMHRSRTANRPPKRRADFVCWAAFMAMS